MNRLDFGRLVASLRKEHEDEDDKPWSQERLAREANTALGIDIFSERIISNIERGQKTLDQQTLLALAVALQLTSGERKEFFLAASGVDNQNTAREDNDAEVVLAQLIERMKQAYLPAHIMDSYCDNVAVNSALLELLDLESTGLLQRALEDRPFALNMLRLIFLDEAVEHLRELTGVAWDDYVLQTVRLFRTISLRYRSTEYFQCLLRELKRSRLFRHYWRGVYVEEKDHFVDNRLIRLASPKWGPIEYFSTYLTALTTAGELHLCIYVPANRTTADTFSKIIEKAGESYTLRSRSWLDKPADCVKTALSR